MLSPYQADALQQLGWQPFVVSALITLCFAGGEPRAGFRYFAAVLHPLLFPAAALFAVAASDYTTRESHALPFGVFAGMFLVGLAGMLASSSPFRGRWWLFAVHPTTAVLACWYYFIGGMTISHDWI